MIGSSHHTPAKMAYRAVLASRHKERGMALFVVLWVVASLSLLVSTFNMLVRTETAATRNALSGARIDAIISGAVELAAAQLAPTLASKGWLPDGRDYRADFADVEMHFRIRDANALVDLNKSSGEVIDS